MHQRLWGNREKRLPQVHGSLEQNALHRVPVPGEQNMVHQLPIPRRTPHTSTRGVLYWSCQGQHNSPSLEWNRALLALSLLYSVEETEQNQFPWSTSSCHGPSPSPPTLAADAGQLAYKPLLCFCSRTQLLPTESEVHAYGSLTHTSTEQKGSH